MAWRMDTLADLEDFYNNLHKHGVEIKRVSNHSLSLGIYIEDPDGNGIEVYYETPGASGTARRSSSCTATALRSTSLVPGRKNSSQTEYQPRANHLKTS